MSTFAACADKIKSLFLLRFLMFELQFVIVNYEDEPVKCEHGKVASEEDPPQYVEVSSQVHATPFICKQTDQAHKYPERAQQQPCRRCLECRLLGGSQIRPLSLDSTFTNVSGPNSEDVKCWDEVKLLAKPDRADHCSECHDGVKCQHNQSLCWGSVIKPAGEGRETGHGRHGGETCGRHVHDLENRCNVEAMVEEASEAHETI